MDKTHPLRPFLDLVAQFMSDASPTRHFGKLLLGKQNGNNESAATEKLAPFAIAVPEGILFRMRIENEGMFAGMAVNFAVDDHSLTVVMYSPQLSTEVVPLSSLVELDVYPNPGGRFYIANELLVTRNGQSPPSSLEGQTDEHGATPATAEIQSVSA